jgi:NADPH-dependent curcumin reductase CurA
MQLHRGFGAGAMADPVNRRIILARRPDGIPRPEHFELVETPPGEPGPGEILIRNRYLSVDPAQRGWANDAPNYSPPVALGEVMRAMAVGEVVASRHPDYRPGEYLTGMFGWQDYCLAAADRLWFRVDPAVAPISTALGVLGLNGLTAYFGLLEIGQPAQGETVVVSTGAGAVGSAVGQIARIQGCRTVAITGSAEKAAMCRTVYGYDAAIDYRAEGDLDAALAAGCPDGVDVYFDNVSGAISDVVLRHLALGARVVICGTASQASWDPHPLGPRPERHLLVKRARMQGLLIFDFADRFDEARRRLAAWLDAGKLVYREDVRDGIESAPAALTALYAGENTGKMVIRL